VGGIMIYYGHNRLENWYIDQLDSVTDFTRSLVANEIADVPQTIQEFMVPELRSLRSEKTSSEDYDDTSTVGRMVGANMVRAGVAILLVPDPVPLVDELVGAGLIAIGSTIIAFS
jgi:hypothetical protein